MIKNAPGVILPCSLNLLSRRTYSHSSGKVFSSSIGAHAGPKINDIRATSIPLNEWHGSVRIELITSLPPLLLDLLGWRSFCSRVHKVSRGQVQGRRIDAPPPLKRSWIVKGFCFVEIYWKSVQAEVYKH